MRHDVDLERRGQPVCGRESLESSLESRLVAPASASASLEAVRAHIEQHPGTQSSRALAGLVRALYLGGSAFTFDSLDCLGPLARRHAECLIGARLWDACAADEWERAYALVSAYEFAEAGGGALATVKTLALPGGDDPADRGDDAHPDSPEAPAMPGVRILRPVQSLPRAPTLLAIFVAVVLIVFDNFA